MLLNNLPNAIIVGGSRGIGWAIAAKFLQNSYNVTIVSRNEKNLINGYNSLKALSNDSHPISSVDYRQCDLARESDINQTCQNLIDSFNKQNKRIDILVNSAGITYNKLLISSKADEIHKVFAANLVGTILFTKMLSKQMIRQKQGSIINIGSIVGLTGNAGQTIYSASKAALLGFTKSLAKELGPKQIRVNLVVPGLIHTDMTNLNVEKTVMEKMIEKIPLNRIGSAKEVANAAYFIGTSPFITGSILVVDGGMSLNF